MKIAIGSDHAGFEYKSLLRDTLRERGHDVTDFGTHSAQPVDYPPIVRTVANAVADRTHARGIVVGGSGNGEAIVANRVRGIRCTLCWNRESARLACAHNDSNVLALGERLITPADVLAILDVWLTTDFEGGRHARRIAQIDGPP